MKRERLIPLLASSQLQPVAFRWPDSEQGWFVVTAHGARVLGLFTHEQADNAYFVNPELGDAASAKKFLVAEHVLGGDRLWIAPERGLFFRGNTLEEGTTTQ